MVSVLPLAVALMTPGPERALADYLAKPDSSYGYEAVGEGRYKVTSQTWKGTVWRHDLIVKRPSEGSETGTFVLHVTGGGPNANDLDWAQRLADQSGLPVATLFQIPAQPLWGKVEDDLIAHTFEQFLATGDTEWPLLLPMTKAAVKAMDALVSIDPGAKRFVVTGASKRGWTSWLTAASGDPRVAGVMPMVFDNLDFGAQLAKQQRDWGRFSPMIDDYTDRGLQDVMESPRGKELVRIVDPAQYERALKAPVLMVHGSNDPYWTVDALSVYWGRLTGPKAVVVVPNMGHGWGSTDFWTPATAAFARGIEAGESLPQVVSAMELDDDGQILVSARFTGAQPQSVEAWVAEGEGLKFDKARWSQRPAQGLGQGDRKTWIVGLKPGDRQQGVLLTATFVEKGLTYRLTTPVHVVGRSR